MVILYVISAILILTTFWFYWKYRSLHQLIGMMAEKASLSSENKNFIKIEPFPDSNLQEINIAFNGLVKALNEATAQIEDYQKKGKITENLDSKIRDIENSISRITVLSDAGKGITSSLNFREILTHLFEFIASVLDAEEIDLYYNNEGVITLLNINQSGSISEFDGVKDSPRTQIWSWVTANAKEALLNNAQIDFQRFLDCPVASASGLTAESVFSVPLMHHHKAIGSIAVYSIKESSFDKYHEEIIRSLSSFVAVAMDNSSVYKQLESSKQEVEAEKQKSDALLLNILPHDVAQELKETGSSKARLFKNVTVLFSDFVNFTKISANMSPEKVVEELDSCFRAFDEISVKYGLEKIKTIGDAYLAVSGLPVVNDEHASKMIYAAKEMMAFLKKREHSKKCNFYTVRIGINSGPVAAGIVGSTKFAYDIWGDTVNTAARLEQNSEPGKINISGSTYNLIKEGFNTTYRGKINAKNKGEIEMYFVED